MKRNRNRIALGLAATVFAALLLDFVVPEPSPDLTASLARMAIITVFSFGLGGLIAKQQFLFPAAALAFSIWLIATSYSMYIAIELHNPLWSQFIWNLPSLVFLIPAAMIGTIAGSKIGARIQRDGEAAT